MKIGVLRVLCCAFVAFIIAAGPAAAKGSIRKDTYDELAKVHKLIASGQYEEATTRLGDIDTAKAAAYEQALVLQTQGCLHARKQQYQEAITALKGCLALSALPKSAIQDAQYLLIQMHLAVANYEDAATGIDTWLASEKQPPAEAHALAGSIFAQVKRLDEAADRLQKAIDQSKEPSELWFRQLAAVYSGAQRHEDAAALLTDAVKRFPQRKEYWLQLANTCQALGNNAKALAVIELAYQRGLPFDEGELLKLANLLIYMELPYKAADLLEKALSTGAVTSSAENWRLLSNAWLRARETPKALAALASALEIEPSADLQLRRAQLAAEIEKWSVTYEAAEAALAAGGLEQPGVAYLLRGTAHYHLDRRAEALADFEQARSYETSRAQAERWIDHLSGRMTALGDGPAQEPTNTLNPADG